MSEEVFSEIKSTTGVLSMLQLREKTFRKELEFLNLKREKVSQKYASLSCFGAWKRLEHEVGFLCVDTYSLYQGIEKKKSLYSKIIQQNGKLLSKIDKTPIDKNTCEFLVFVASNEEMRPSTPEEENDFIEKLGKEAYNSREALKIDSGITSHKHND